MADMRGMLEDLPRDYCDAMTGAGRAAPADDAVCEWKAKDRFSTPVFVAIGHVNTGDAPAFLVYVHGTPLQEEPGYCEEHSR